MFVSPWLYAVAVLWLSAFAADAQAPLAPTPAPPATSSPGAEGLIRLDVVVTNAAGSPVAGLSRNSFSILDGGQAEPIVSFSSFAARQGILQPNPPSAITVLFDTLGLPPSITHLEHQQLEAFLRQNGGHLAQPISLLTLNDMGLWEVAAPSADGDALADRLARGHFAQLLRSPGYVRTRAANAWEQGAFGGTVSNATLENLGAIATAERRIPGRKMLLWIGPGWGIGTGKSPDIEGSRQTSFDTLVWFSTLLRDARVTLYSFSAGPVASFSSNFLQQLFPGDLATGAQAQLAPSDASVPAAKFLRAYVRISSPKEMSDAALNRNVLAIASGGRALPPAIDLVAQMNACLREANTFYTLTFNPAPARNHDEYHDIQVRMEMPGLRARTAMGYYDQPYYTDQPDPALHRLSVAQLGQMLEADRGQSDSELARRLRNVTLAERLSGSKLAEWTAQLPGKKSRQALTVLADMSAFLDPPAAGMVTDPSPDTRAQQQMIARVTDYLTHTMTGLPNFYARRAAALYVNTPPTYDGSLKISPGEPVHLVSHSRGTVLYRDGTEIVDAKKSRHPREMGTLSTYGTFGPLLKAVLDNIGRHNLVWSQWESGSSGRRAVFRFAVPVAQSHYVVAACCLPSGVGRTTFARAVGYRGEIAVDPHTGAILRVMISAELGGIVPLDRSEIMVSYGPVSIGGRTYICPLHSVSFMHSRNVDTWQLWDENFRTWGPWLSMLNDFTFGNYHIFRANVRMLSGFTEPHDSSPSKGTAPQ